MTIDASTWVAIMPGMKDDVKSPSDVASAWFHASEALGDFMGIRYGRIPKGTGEIEWSFVSHCDCDGMGGFARLLRERGVSCPVIPETRNSCRKIISPLWNLWQDSLIESPCANRSDWLSDAAGDKKHVLTVGWHLFTRDETRSVIGHCRRLEVTVNSYLLKCLDQAVRSVIRRPHADIPWMIPVNLRGDVRRADDTANHVSCIEPKIAADDTPRTIHVKMLHRLQCGEHRAKLLILSLGRILSHQAKIRIIEKDRTKPDGNIGAFSNLGVWQAGSEQADDDGWVFCPPCVSGQLLGAGCVTFQGRLGLAAQGYHHLAATAGAAPGLMNRWTSNILSFSS